MQKEFVFKSILNNFDPRIVHNFVELMKKLISVTINFNEHYLNLSPASKCFYYFFHRFGMKSYARMENSDCIRKIMHHIPKHLSEIIRTL